MSLDVVSPITFSDDSWFYIERNADSQLYTLVLNRDYISVIGPSLSGKTEMLRNLIAKLRILPDYVTIGLNIEPAQRVPKENWFAQFYHGIVNHSTDNLPLPTTAVSHPSAIQEKLLQVLQHNPNVQTLVIILNHVEHIPRYWRNSLFAAVREMYINRAVRPLLNKIVFVLAGRFIPYELIDDPAISPFRETEIVYVDNADQEEMDLLIAEICGQHRAIDDDALERLYYWTHGDIFLTSVLCDELTYAGSDEPITEDEVDRVAHAYIEDETYIRESWSQLDSIPEVVSLLNTLIDQRSAVPFTLMRQPVALAWFAGAIKRTPDGYCELRSLIHEFIFKALQ